jgi:hypothetical protein
MRTGRLVLLALVVVALGAYILLVERHAPTTDQLKEREGKLFASFDQAKATKLTIENSHGRFVLAKEKDAWTLTAPLADDANQGAVTGLLYSLSALKADRTFKAGEVKPAEYGLDKPKLQLTVDAEGGKSYTLKLGNELPLGNEIAAVAGSGPVVLVSKSIASDLDKDLSGWRSDRLAQVYSTDVASLTVANASGQVALAHAGPLWTITSPSPDLADRDRAEAVINDVSGARIKEFVDNAPDLKAMGLDPRRFGVTIIRRAPNAAPITLDFGNERDAKGTAEVACKRGDRVFWVEAKTVAHLAGPWQQWRSQKLVEFDSWAAEKFELAAGAAKATLERAGGVWKSGAVEVDGDAVSRRLEDLSTLQVKAFDLPKPAGASLGAVKVSGEGFAVDASFYPGSTAGEDVAVVAGRTGGLGVEAAKVKALLADPAALAKPKPTPTPVSTPTKPPAKGAAGKATPAAKK